MNIFKRIAAAYRDWKYVEEPPDPNPTLRSRLQSLRHRLVELKKSATRLRLFNMEKEAEAKEYLAKQVQKEIRKLNASLSRTAA